VETQSFSVYRNGQTTDYKNVYAIVRAPRAASTESILFTLPWKCINGEPNFNGIAYGLEFASFFSKFSHWSKDLIILIPDGGLFGTHAWLEAYHGQYNLNGGRKLIIFF
jgi:GPI-anchor transamidase subunit GAA1